MPVTDAFRHHIEERGAAAHKITVVKNGVDLERFSRPRRDPGLARELGLEGSFTAAYFGTHGMAHALDSVLRAAELLRDDPRIVFLLVGDGAERRRLLTMKERLGLTNVVMLEQQPKERMPALWGLTDAALVLLRKAQLFETVIPSKIFEAMGAGRPIVLGVEGEVPRHHRGRRLRHSRGARESRAAGGRGAPTGRAAGTRPRDGGQRASLR